VSDDAEPVALVDIKRWLASQEWRNRAACAGVASQDDLFFPRQGEITEPGKAICRGCAVRAECLDFAMINDEHYGIWGGLSRRERVRLRKRVQAA
jgi:WhiB family redox-sensing transcriptional regulator